MIDHTRFVADEEHNVRGQAGKLMSHMVWNEIYHQLLDPLSSVFVVVRQIDTRL